MIGPSGQQIAEKCDAAAGTSRLVLDRAFGLRKARWHV
jgi:hypothetical protein